MTIKINEIILQGARKRNYALVLLLGTCPLLALTSTAIKSLVIGLTTTLVLTLTNFFISAMRYWIPTEIRIPIYVIIIASVVSVILMLINAYAFSFYQLIGVFIPLIATNCIVIGRAEMFAIKNNPLISALDGFTIGIGTTSMMFILGVMRELLSNGTLFEGADILLGDWAKALYIEVFHYTDSIFLLATLPPGIFVGLGMILAIKHIIGKKWERFITKRERNILGSISRK